MKHGLLDPIPSISDLVGLGMKHEILHFCNLPGGADAAGLRITFANKSFSLLVNF